MSAPKITERRNDEVVIGHQPLSLLEQLLSAPVPAEPEQVNETQNRK
jgi:hypothetical protein